LNFCAMFFVPCYSSVNKPNGECTNVNIMFNMKITSESKHRYGVPCGIQTRKPVLSHGKGLGITTTL
jgi:hypothetical protein